MQRNFLVKLHNVYFKERIAITVKKFKIFITYINYSKLKVTNS